MVLHGIAIKPGKTRRSGPGARQNPGARSFRCWACPATRVSGILVLERIFKPVLDLLTCRATEKVAEIEAVISRRLTSSLKYREFHPRAPGIVGGRMIAVRSNRGAGVVSSFVNADGIIDIPQDTEGYEVGEACACA